MTGRATTAQTVDGATLGHRIRHFRKARGMTLDELGQRIGKTAPFLSMLENGKREPRLGLLNDIAAALDVDTVELMSPQPPTRRAELELALTGAQDDPLYAGLGPAPPPPVGQGPRPRAGAPNRAVPGAAAPRVPHGGHP